MNLLIIGAGPAGYEAAIRASQFGHEVILVEKQYLGGTCLNVGCIPSKTLLSYAEEIYKLKNLRSGLSVSETKIDLNLIFNEKTSLINKLQKGIENILKSHKITILKGEAKFLDANSVEVNNNKFTFDKALLATGSIPFIPKTLFLDGFTITSTDVLENAELGNNILIVGGGIIGCELAFILNSFGKNITIVEKEDGILGMQDKDAIRLLELSMKKKGIIVKKGLGVTKLETGKVFLENGETILCDKCVIAIGRIPNTKNLSLEKAGIELGKRGEVLVDENFLTSNKNIYAVGDVNGKIQLAHFASSSALKVIHTISNKEFYTNLDLVPQVTYTMPEIASIYSKNFDKINDKSFKFLLGGLGKAIAINVNEGFCKIFINREEYITGAVMVGPDADNLINIFTLAINSNFKVHNLTGIIYPHPSLSEVILETAEDANSLAIHKLRR